MLLAFNDLGKFSNANFQPFYFPARIDFVEHLPVLGFTENTKLYTADKNSGIHNLVLDLVGLEKFNATKDSTGYKRQGVCAVDNNTREHSSAVELTYHRQEIVFLRLIVSILNYFPNLFIVHFLFLKFSLLLLVKFHYCTLDALSVDHL